MATPRFICHQASIKEHLNQMYPTQCILPHAGQQPHLSMTIRCGIGRPLIAGEVICDDPYLGLHDIAPELDGHRRIIAVTQTGATASASAEPAPALTRPTMRIGSIDDEVWQGRRSRCRRDVGLWQAFRKELIRQLSHAIEQIAIGVFHTTIIPFPDRGNTGNKGGHR
jgi:hypothetical protein